MNWNAYRQEIDALLQNSHFIAETLKKIEAGEKKGTKRLAPVMAAGAAAVVVASALTVWTLAPREPAVSAVSSSEQAAISGTTSGTAAASSGTLPPNTFSSAAISIYTPPSRDAYDWNITGDGLYTPDLSRILRDAPVIIRGKVREVSYTSVEHNAWSIITIDIQQVYKGDVRTGGTLTVYQMGGYISMREHVGVYHDAERWGLSDSELDDKVVRQTVDNEPLPEAGDENLYCLTRTPENSPLPDSVYERLSPYGQLKVLDGGARFEQCLSGGQFSSGEIAALLE